MANKNAIIRSRITKNNKLRTETALRDSGPEFAASTDSRGRTQVYLDLSGRRSYPYADVVLNGREARTLFRLLAKHYGYTSKSLEPVLPARDDCTYCAPVTCTCVNDADTDWF